MPKPEEGLFAHLGLLAGSQQLEQEVDPAFLFVLCSHENDLLLELPLGRGFEEGPQIFDSYFPSLAEPEDRTLAQLDIDRSILRDIQQPCSRLGTILLGHGEDHLVLQLAIGQLSEETREELDVVPFRLPDPEDRFRSDLHRLSAIGRNRSENLPRPIVA